MVEIPQTQETMKVHVVNSEFSVIASVIDNWGNAIKTFFKSEPDEFSSLLKKETRNIDVTCDGKPQNIEDIEKAFGLANRYVGPTLQFLTSRDFSNTLTEIVISSPSYERFVAIDNIDVVATVKDDLGSPVALMCQNGRAAGIFR